MTASKQLGLKNQDLKNLGKLSKITELHRNCLKYFVRDCMLLNLRLIFMKLV